MKVKEAYITFVVLALLSAIPGFIFPQQTISAWANSHHNPLLDILFSFYSSLGEATGIILALIIILLRDARFFFYFAFALLLQALMVSFFKHWLFADALRPWWELKEQMHVAEGIFINKHHSFPSGHTATAFCVFGFLSFSSKKNIGAIFWMLNAALIGYSRIYLGQHYWIDVFAGAFLGIFFSGLLTYFYFKNTHHYSLDNKL